MADGHGNRDDPEGVWRNRQGAHAAQVAAQDRVLLEKGQVRPVQVSLQREAGGVQKGGRGVRVPEARGRHGRLCRGRGRGPKVLEPRLRVEADRGARADQSKLLKGVCQDIRRDVPRRAANKDRGVDELGDVPGISGGDPQEPSAVIHGP